MDSTGCSFQGIGSWQTIRFHKRARKRDHRKLSLLVETLQGQEKFAYDWRLDGSRVGDVTAAGTILPSLPPRTKAVAMDGAYDAYDLYELVEAQGAQPVIKARTNAKEGTVDARGRAVRQQRHHPKAWKRKYNRRPITESVNYAIKRRFGDRLWSRDLRAQGREMAQRVLVRNLALLVRWMLRNGVSSRD